MRFRFALGQWALGLGLWVSLHGVGAAATLDVTNYGAVPGDATDDAPAIQQAIAAALSQDTVYFPAGTYQLGQSLRPTARLKLLGAGQGLTILKYDSSAPFNLIVLSGVSQVEISNLTLDGGHQPTVLNGIYAYNGGRHSLHHLTIRNFDDPAGSFGIFFTGNIGDSNYGNGVTDSLIADNTIDAMSPSFQEGGGFRMAWG